jgi:hypothetical protein
MKIFALIVLALQLTVVAGMNLNGTDSVNSVPRPGCLPCDRGV